MKNILVFILAMTLIAGCSKKDDKGLTDKTIKDPNTRDSVSEISYKIEEIPKTMIYSGTVVASVNWKDKNGLNFVIISETKEKTKEVTDGNNNKNSVKSKELFGYQYIMKNDSADILWRIQDFQEKCNSDLFLNYVSNSLSVTDVNKNDIGECTFLYTMGCMSDVSPLTYKLLMREGIDKYVIKGTQLVVTPNFKPYGGEINIDKSFDNAPAGFLDYAKQQWKIFEKQKL